MNQKLIDFFKFNNHEFEELSFANSNFIMPENDFLNSNFLLASEGPIKQPSSKSDSLPEGYIQIDNTGFFDRIKSKIVDFFKPKSKPITFKVEKNSIVNIGNDYPSRPIYSFFSNIGSKMVDATEKFKTTIRNSKVKNQPLVYSESLVSLENKKTKSLDEKVGLLGEGVKDASFIVPNEVQNIADFTPEPPIFSSDKKQVTYKSSDNGLHNRKNSISSLIKRHERDSMIAISAYRGNILELNPGHSISVEEPVLPETDIHDKSEH